MVSASAQAPVVLVTGAARRVGAAIARAVHARGACLALHYRRSRDEAEQLAEQLNAARPRSAATFAADLLDTAALPRLVNEVLARFGRLDGLVNNASSFAPTPLGAIDLAAWDDLVGSNLKAPLFLTQAVAPALRERKGAVVNIIDIHADRPLPGYPVYCAAKAGLLGLTRAMAVELAPDVRVNGVSPGAVLWPEDQSFSPREQRAIVDHTLLKAEGSPDDIAIAVRFLLFEATYVTGQILAVDGGRSAHL